MTRTAFLVCGLHAQLLVTSVAGDLESRELSSAPGVSTAGSRPGIHLQELTHDFGRVAAGSILNHEFTVSNTGDAPLEIADIKTGCGCVIPGHKKLALLPRQSSRIPIRFDTSGLRGEVAKSVQIQHNVPGLTNIVLRIKANLWRPIEMIPERVLFPPLDSTNRTEVTTIIITNNIGTPLTLSNATCLNPQFRAELKCIQTNRAYELVVRTVPPLHAGLNQAFISIQSSFSNQPLIIVKVIAIAQKPLTISPAAIELPRGGGADSFTLPVLVSGTAHCVWELTEAKTALPGVVSKIQLVQAGRIFRVQLVFPASFRLAEKQNAALQLKTTHPEFPSIDIPIRNSDAFAIENRN
jgi:hypothetical protein